MVQKNGNVQQTLEHCTFDYVQYSTVHKDSKNPYLGKVLKDKVEYKFFLQKYLMFISNRPEKKKLTSGLRSCL